MRWMTNSAVRKLAASKCLLRLYLRKMATLFTQHVASRRGRFVPVLGAGGSAPGLSRHCTTCQHQRAAGDSRESSSISRRFVTACMGACASVRPKNTSIICSAVCAYIVARALVAACVSRNDVTERNDTIRGGSPPWLSASTTHAWNVVLECTHTHRAKKSQAWGGGRAGAAAGAAVDAVGVRAVAADTRFMCESMYIQSSPHMRERLWWVAACSSCV